MAISGKEQRIVSRYNAAKRAEQMAAREIGEHFWPLVRAAITETEARDILDRVPGCVEKSFFMDHFRYVSKVIPPLTAPEIIHV